LDEKESGVHVEGPCAKGRGDRDIRHGSVLLQFVVVTLGGVIREQESSEDKSHQRTRRSRYITDLIKKRSDGEPDEKGDEEAQPRKVEGYHVGTRKVAKLDLSGFIILIGIDIKGVLLELLLFALHPSKSHETEKEKRKHVVVRILSRFYLSIDKQISLCN
jgi:hypothetical protein